MQDFIKKSWVRKTLAAVSLALIIIILFEFIFDFSSRVGGLPCQVDDCLGCPSVNDPQTLQHKPIKPLYDSVVKFHLILGQYHSYKNYVSHIQQEQQSGCYAKEIKAELVL